MEYDSIYKVSRIYQSFELIDRSSFHTLIRFFEENEEEIKRLDFDEYFEILVAYVQALFDVGAYGKHAKMADVVIEASIINNVNVYKGINLYEKTLFQKAASLYHLHQSYKSSYILTELLKINPADGSYKTFLIKNKMNQKPKIFQIIQGVAIALFFCTVFCIALTTFYLEPFRQNWVEGSILLRNIFFISGILILLISDLIFRVSVFWEVGRLIQKSKEKLKTAI